MRMPLVVRFSDSEIETFDLVIAQLADGLDLQPDDARPQSVSPSERGGRGSATVTVASQGGGMTYGIFRTSD
jgi:hypothetical protein